MAVVQVILVISVASIFSIQYEMPLEGSDLSLSVVFHPAFSHSLGGVSP